jgi:hypothetical protein
MDLFRRVLGDSATPERLGAFKLERPFFFLGLLTLKIWMDGRA